MARPCAMGDDMTIHRVRFVASALSIVLLGATAGHAQPVQGCPAVVELQSQRSTALSDLLAGLRGELETAPESERRAIEQKIRHVETRQHLLDVAYQRLNGPRLNDKKCEAIEAFILRHSSVS